MTPVTPLKSYPEGNGAKKLKRLTLKELPPEERPRERLREKGAASLTDAELLAIIIRDGTRSESALDLARRLLLMFGDLRELKDAGMADLCKVSGIGPARAAQVKAALALAARIGEATLRRGSPFTQSKAVYDHFHPRLRYLKKECIFCVLLDAKNRVQKEVEISSGGLSTAIAHPRDILRAAVAESAHAVILIHNHPSGDPAPSEDDIQLTRRVKKVAELAGIRFLDHIIIGEEGYASMADMGHM